MTGRPNGWLRRGVESRELFLNGNRRQLSGLGCKDACCLEWISSRAGQDQIFATARGKRNDLVALGVPSDILGWLGCAAHARRVCVSWPSLANRRLLFNFHGPTY